MLHSAWITSNVVNEEGMYCLQSSLTMFLCDQRLESWGILSTEMPINLEYKQCTYKHAISSNLKVDWANSKSDVWTSPQFAQSTGKWKVDRLSHQIKGWSHWYTILFSIGIRNSSLLKKRIALAGGMSNLQPSAQYLASYQTPRELNQVKFSVTLIYR